MLAPEKKSNQSSVADSTNEVPEDSRMHYRECQRHALSLADRFQEGTPQTGKLASCKSSRLEA